MTLKALSIRSAARQDPGSGPSRSLRARTHIRALCVLYTLSNAAGPPSCAHFGRVRVLTDGRLRRQLEHAALRADAEADRRGLRHVRRTQGQGAWACGVVPT